MSAENETLVATELAAQLEEKKENAAIVDFKMVTFSLADKDYSIDIMHVKEIAKAGRRATSETAVFSHAEAKTEESKRGCRTKVF